MELAGRSVWLFKKMINPSQLRAENVFSGYLLEMAGLKKRREMSKLSSVDKSTRPVQLVTSNERKRTLMWIDDWLESLTDNCPYSGLDKFVRYCYCDRLFPPKYHTTAYSA